MKYLVTVMQGITVEADTPEDAEAKGVAMLDGGFGETVAVEVEPLSRKENEGAMNKLLYFACDRCMNRWSAYRAGECPACRHEAVWEFDKEANRDQYVHDHEMLFRRV